ncbi:hypothetical protein [Mastigocladopsis repens]|nr:hypothetical protein [Mastigocladopsis repens]
MALTPEVASRMTRSTLFVRRDSLFLSGWRNLRQLDRDFAEEFRR